MENAPQENPKVDLLQNFKQRITDLKNDPKESFSLIDVVPEDLILEDMEMYDKYVSGDISVDEFREYQKKVFDQSNHGRKSFAAHLGNKIGGMLLKKQLAEKISE